MGSRRFGASTALVPFVIVMTAGTLGCADGDPSCDDLRDELAQFQPEAADAWEDIAVLAEDVGRGLELQREYSERCDSGGSDTDRGAAQA